MAIPYRITGGHSRRSPLPLPTARALLAAVITGAVLSILCVLSFTDSFSYLGFQPRSVDKRESSRKYLYWGARIDCPGKHCSSCAGLGHQESSLRCALEEALFLDRPQINLVLVLVLVASCGPLWGGKVVLGFMKWVLRW